MTTIHIPRSLIMATLLGALVIAPMFVLAKDGAEYDKSGVHAVGSELSIQVNNNGKVLVRGAKVSAVNGSTITAATLFGSTSVSWIITTNGSTEFVDRGGRNGSLSSITAGDIISFNGALDPNASSLTVTATIVKDWSKNLKVLEKHTFEGKLESAMGTTTLPTSFAFLSGGIHYLVNVAAGVPILSKNWASTNLSIFQVNDTVRVYGSVQASSTSVIDAVVVRNASR